MIQRQVRIGSIIAFLQFFYQKRHFVKNKAPQAAQAKAAIKSLALAAKKDVRILPVEDNIMNQQVAMNTLSVLGYTVEVADNGQHALEKIGESNYDLIFMDLQMPLMDGLEATRQIRAEFNEPAPYIIALTANAMESDYEACMAAGMRA